MDECDKLYMYLSLYIFAKERTREGKERRHICIMHATDPHPILIYTSRPLRRKKRKGADQASSKKNRDRVFKMVTLKGVRDEGFFRHITVKVFFLIIYHSRGVWPQSNKDIVVGFPGVS